jgi:hypothetical protein
VLGYWLMRSRLLVNVVHNDFDVVGTIGEVVGLFVGYLDVDYNPST